MLTHAALETLRTLVAAAYVLLPALLLLCATLLAQLAPVRIALPDDASHVLAQRRDAAAARAIATARAAHHWYAIALHCTDPTHAELAFRRALSLIRRAYTYKRRAETFAMLV